MLCKVLLKMHANACEARELMFKANMYREHHRRAADWYRDMALMHVQFNTLGREIVREEMALDMDEGERRVYEDMAGQIMDECQEARLAVELYKA